METQNELELGIGSKEAITLKPANVKITETKIVEVGEKQNKEEEKPKWKKVVCVVKHPDREEPIEISSVKYERNGKLLVTGLWVNKDEDNLIQKGSALAVLMNFLNAEVIKDLTDKEASITEDDKGYLCFKAY